MPFGKSGVEPFRVRSMCPLKGGSGGGKTLGVSAAAGPGSAVEATADAAMMEVEASNQRRLKPVRDAILDFTSDLSSLIVSFQGLECR